MSRFSKFRPYLVQSFRNRVALLGGWVVFTPLLLHSVVGLTWGLTALASVGVLLVVALSITLSSYQRHQSKF
ncbi:hypothetical protein [Deinococcus ruber]|uniref:Uncharacterized protein n=1 Tax=Deinococcus ruber TaxID=1848197 RepID=A0A918F7X8_9DEIO|nr:hypothetical protein [Deinococcus ruber]GGR17574.1 hypothetical protein GCM10008957_32930 [Deinococcus ruber]